MTSEEKQKLIDRLKTVKDPREREQILWALEDMKKASSKTDLSPTPEKETVSSPPGQVRIPITLPKGLTLLTRFAAPILCIFFGLSFILQALLRGLEQKDLTAEVGQFITGTIFLIFGFAALQKAKKIEQMSGQEEGKNPENS